MNVDKLKDLLYKSYSLGFEDGVSSGYYYKLDEKWSRAKYCFEEDIEKMMEQFCEVWGRGNS